MATNQKNIIGIGFLLTFAVLSSISSCKKKETPEPQPDLTPLSTKYYLSSPRQQDEADTLVYTYYPNNFISCPANINYSYTIGEGCYLCTVPSSIPATNFTIIGDTVFSFFYNPVWRGTFTTTSDSTANLNIRKDAQDYNVGGGYVMYSAINCTYNKVP